MRLVGGWWLGAWLALGCSQPGVGPSLPIMLEPDGRNSDASSDAGAADGWNPITAGCSTDQCVDPAENESTTSGEASGETMGEASDGSSSTGEPPSWTCLPSRQGDEVCDCGCGALDVDCAGPQLEYCERCPSLTLGGCDFDGSCEAIDPDDNASCLDPQLFWTCPPLWFTDEQCDCGCGAPDPACETLEESSCERCGCGGEGEDSCDRLIEDASWRCVPPEWSCSLLWYEDDECDCGCGSVDPFCASADASHCDYCAPLDAGGCTSDGTCASIDPADNSTCI